MKQVHSENVTFDNASGYALERKCLCGRGLVLWFNGGELDSHRCKCGREHRLDHTVITYVVREPRP